MRRKLIILTSEKEEWKDLIGSLEAECAKVTFSPAMEKLGECIRKTGSLAVIIDLDFISVDNRVVREYAQGYPEVSFFGASIDRFHPDLQDAISNHFCACLRKPIDLDEIIFWLKSLYENNQIRANNDTREGKPDE
jgi:hypothetical protein